MKKSEKNAKKFDIDDLSKNIFMKAMNEALDTCNGNMLQLSAKLDLKSRCDAWVKKGQMPPYKKMQEIYPKLVKIAGSKND